MDHNEDCPCATDNVPHGAGCADCSCIKNICPTCEGESKFEVIDGKCKACRLGVVPDWAKGTEKRKDETTCVDCKAVFPLWMKYDHICEGLKR